MKKIKELIAVALVGVSIGTVVPIQANAEWKQDNKGWWYAKEDGGYYKNEWLYTGQTWYNFDDNGYLQTNTVVDGYQLNSKGEYKGKKREVKALNQNDVNNLPDVNIGGTSIDIKTMSVGLFTGQGNKDIRQHYIDSNGKTVYLYRTNASLFENGKKINKCAYGDNPLYEYESDKFDEHNPSGGTTTLGVAGKVDTVLYEDTKGNVLYKARVKNDTLYFYDKDDKPLANKIVNGKITDANGAWKAGNIRNRMINPINKPDFKLNVYPEQLDEICLSIENSYKTPENVTFIIDNNCDDGNNNLGQIKFKDDWETYRLSDDGKQWIDMFEDCNDNSSIHKEFTIPYRGDFAFWFDKTSDVYTKAFSKPGTYLIVSNDLQLAQVVNIK